MVKAEIGVSLTHYVTGRRS